MSPHHRYRCRYCGRVLPAWLPSAEGFEVVGEGLPMDPCAEETA
jgi:hypothetical protein